MDFDLAEDQAAFQALFATTGALGQLSLFWVAPLPGAALGGLCWKLLIDPEPAS
jgi:hypothetical protein